MSGCVHVSDPNATNETIPPLIHSTIPPFPHSLILPFPHSTILPSPHSHNHTHGEKTCCEQKQEKRGKG